MRRESSAGQAARTLLGVPVDADPLRVARAYRHHARRLHPDVSMDPDAAAQFLALQTAYQLALEDARHFTRCSGPHREARAAAGTEAVEHRGPTVVLETSTNERPVSGRAAGGAPWLVAGPVRVRPPHAGGGSRR